jgi:hypothetical protein
MDERPGEVIGSGPGDARRDAAADDLGGAAETEAIRDDIERTRAEMSETIDAIQERLSPANIKDQVVEQVREQVEVAKDTVREATIGKVENMMQSAGNTVSDARRSVVDAVKQNPIPAALVGIGIGWMIVSGRRSSSRGNGRHVGYGAPRGGMTGDAALRSYGSGSIPYKNQRAKPARGGQGRGAASGAADFADSAREFAERWAGQAQSGAQAVGDRFQETLRESPLMIGATALAVGAAVGFAIPQTRKENELMGEARDGLVETAGEVARDAMRQVEGAADRLTQPEGQSADRPPSGPR